MKNIWVPLSGQIAQQRKVENIANNIANANTVGYKKDRLTFKEHLTALTEEGALNQNIDLPRKEWSPDDFYRSQGAENAFVKVDGSYTNFKQGSLSPTQNSMDFALSGKGFFEVLTPRGPRYTRNGQFSLNSEGNIVNSDGHYLLKKAADETPFAERLINLSQIKSFSLSKEGKVFSPQGQLAEVSVVEFKDNASLKKEGGMLFVNNDLDNIVREGVKTAVHQGFVEQSNVNAISEMSELIKAHRHFENIQKAINTYDSIAGKAANDISKF